MLRRPCSIRKTQLYYQIARQGARTPLAPDEYRTTIAMRMSRSRRWSRARVASLGGRQGRVGAPAAARCPPRCRLAGGRAGHEPLAAKQLAERSELVSFEGTR
jgi:hypothetical protein